MHASEGQCTPRAHTSDGGQNGTDLELDILRSMVDCSGRQHIFHRFGYQMRAVDEYSDICLLCGSRWQDIPDSEKVVQVTAFEAFSITEQCQHQSIEECWDYRYWWQKAL